MISIKEKYVVDEKGKQLGVMLDLKEYKRVLENLEDLNRLGHSIEQKLLKKNLSLLLKLLRRLIRDVNDKYLDAEGIGIPEVGTRI
jgi:hypothetical protein